MKHRGAVELGQPFGIRDATRVVTIRRRQLVPAIYTVTCSCGVHVCDTGDQVDGIEKFQAHAEQAGHDGEWAVVIADGN